MRDIVEQLRAEQVRYRKLFDQADQGEHGGLYAAMTLMQNAADEIERLKEWQRIADARAIEVADLKRALHAEQEESMHAGSQLSALRLRLSDFQEGLRLRGDDVAEARRKALEEAADLCFALRFQHPNDGEEACNACGEAIRAAVEKGTT
jgi:hypothetical protein